MLGVTSAATISGRRFARVGVCLARSSLTYNFVLHHAGPTLAHWFSLSRTRHASSSPTPQPKMEPAFPRHLLSMSDLNVAQIQNVIDHAANLKAAPQSSLEQTLTKKTIAILFTKRSTRTRVATETSVASLGGHSMFLGPSDIQLGVNESLYDSARIIGSMSHGIMARVGRHDEVEVSSQAGRCNRRMSMQDDPDKLYCISLLPSYSFWPRKLVYRSSMPYPPSTTRRRSWLIC